MGVLPCHRKDCEEIMCDIYVDGVGYVCYDCQREFKDYLETKGIEEISEGQMKRELKMFMATVKDEFTEGDEITVDDFFKKHSR